MANRRVLLIEDDCDIARLLTLHLRDLGCRVDAFADGREGLDRATAGTSWSLIVLDLALPGVDGLEICRQARAREVYTPILMLTARAEESDRVLGLETGADDYLTKPFSVVEFSARVKALLRRAERLSQGTPVALRTLRHGDLELDMDSRVARRGSTVIELTAKEFDLLACLMQYPTQVFSRSQLLDRVWGSTHDAYEHTVNSHINRLRAKLEHDSEQPRYIVTVWGAGYRFGSEIDTQRE